MKTTTDEILRAALTGYQLQMDQVSAKIAEIENMLGLTVPLRGRKPSAKTATSKPAKKQKHKMSAAGRHAISIAQRLRWQKSKAALHAKLPNKPKRTRAVAA